MSFKTSSSINTLTFSANLYQFIDALWETYQENGYVSKAKAGTKIPTMEAVRHRLSKNSNLRLPCGQLDWIIDEIVNKIHSSSKINDFYLGFMVKYDLKSEKQISQTARQEQSIGFKDIPRLCPIAFALPSKNLLEKAKIDGNVKIINEEFHIINQPNTNAVFFGKYLNVINSTFDRVVYNFIDHKGIHYHLTGLLNLQPECCYILKIDQVEKNLTDQIYKGLITQYVRKIENVTQEEF